MQRKWQKCGRLINFKNDKYFVGFKVLCSKFPPVFQICVTGGADRHAYPSSHSKKKTEEVSRWMRTLSSSFCRISIFEWRILSDLCFLAGQIWKVTLTQWRNMILITSRTSFRKYRCYSMFRISLNLTTLSLFIAVFGSGRRPILDMKENS